MYSFHHNASHTRPASPAARKRARQPEVRMIAATRGGATIAPRLEPALKIPKAKERSFAEKHSETALAEAGNPPPSPNPKRRRAKPRPATLETRAWSALASDQQSIETAHP